MSNNVLPLFPTEPDREEIPTRHIEAHAHKRATSSFNKDPLIKLRDVEAILRQYFEEGSCPSRGTIIGWIEEGTLQGQQIGTGRNYYVFRSSLEKFKTSLAPMSLAA